MALQFPSVELKPFLKDVVSLVGDRCEPDLLVGLKLLNLTAVDLLHDVESHYLKSHAVEEADVSTVDILLLAEELEHLRNKSQNGKAWTDLVTMVMIVGIQI